jgi:hypothetical protein
MMPMHASQYSHNFQISDKILCLHHLAFSLNWKYQRKNVGLSEFSHNIQRYFGGNFAGLLPTG